MGLPGHRRTSSHKRRRASHFALKKESTNRCAKCGAANLLHSVCATCGYYRGRKVITVKPKKTKAAKK